jgi:hypothetical protein
MPKYAVIVGIEVINIIQAESLQDAERITGFSCVEYTEEPAEPGGTYENGRFIQIKPYPSWILNEEFKWQAPIPYPNDGKNYVWDEAILNWSEVPAEVPTIT